MVPPSSKSPVAPSYDKALFSFRAPPNIDTSGVISGVILIDPQKAAEFLSLGYLHTRRPNKAAIQRYAQDMLDGNWYTTGSCITFVYSRDEKLTLSDGVQRLLAIIEADVAQPMLVSIGHQNKAVLVTDSGSPRTRHSATALFTGVRGHSHYAQFLKYMHLMAHGELIKYTPDQTLDLVLSFEAGCSHVCVGLGKAFVHNKSFIRHIIEAVLVRGYYYYNVGRKPKNRERFDELLENLRTQTAPRGCSYITQFFNHVAVLESIQTPAGGELLLEQIKLYVKTQRMLVAYMTGKKLSTISRTNENNPLRYDSALAGALNVTGAVNMTVLIARLNALCPQP